MPLLEMRALIVVGPPWGLMTKTPGMLCGKPLGGEKRIKLFSDRDHDDTDNFKDFEIVGSDGI